MNYYVSPRWSGEVADCSVPMTFDQYSNCGYGCLYCFANYQRSIGKGKGGYLLGEVTPINIKRFKRQFTEEGYSQFWPYIKDRKVMQWGGMSDPFCPFEVKHGAGLELLRFLRELEYPICFSTKGTWWLKDNRYTELFRDNKNWNVKVSIITLDEAKAHKIEKGTPTPNERLKAIEQIAKLDCGGATLRFRPFMYGVSDPRHVELVKESAKYGATAVSLEFFCLEQRNPELRNRLPIISSCAGFDYMKFYRQFSRGAGYLRLNRNVKRPFVNEIEQACRDTGMRFYVSDAHFKERSDNGSCCGLSPDWNYSRGQFCEALVLCRKNGEVHWDEIAKHMDHLKGFLWERAEGYNVNTCLKRAHFKGFTMYDYVRWLWNHPNAGQSPYTMFEGVIKPVGLDEGGDLVYELDSSRL